MQMPQVLYCIVVVLSSSCFSTHIVLKYMKPMTKRGGGSLKAGRIYICSNEEKNAAILVKKREKKKN